MYHLPIIAKYARAIAARANLAVIFQAANTTPCTTGNIIYLPTPHPQMSQNDAKIYSHYVAHEVNHVLFSDFEALRAMPSMQALVFDLANVWEDTRVDYQGRAFPSDRDNCEIYQLKQVTSWRGTSGDTATPSNVAWALNFLSRMDHLALGLLEEEVAARYPLHWPLAKPWLDKLNAYREHPLKGSADALIAMVKEYLRTVWKYDPDSQESPPPPGCDGRQIPQTPNHGVPSTEEPCAFEKNITSTVSEPGSTLTDWLYAEPVVSRAVPLADAMAHPKADALRDAMPDNRLFTALPTLYNEVVTAARRKLQAELRVKREFDARSGRMARRTLHRLVTNPADGRLFTTKTSGRKIDAAVAIVVDGSGSMTHGDIGKTHRLEFASMAAGLAAYVTNTILRQPVAIYTHTHASETTYIRRVLDFGEPVCDNLRVMCQRVFYSNVEGPGPARNADCEALLYAGEQLLLRKERVKLLLVMSDGAPTGRRQFSGAEACANETKRLVEDLSKHMEVRAIGIQAPGLVHLFPHFQDVPNVWQLTQALLATLDTNI